MTGESPRAAAAPSPTPRARSPRSLAQLFRLAQVLRPHRARFLFATVALVAGSAISLVYPQAVRYAIDQGVERGQIERLDEIVVGLLALFTLQAVLTWARHYQMSWLGQRAVAELRRRVFGRLLTLEPGWYHTRSTGELVGRLASDVTVLENMVGSEVSLALRNALMLVGGIGLLFFENPLLTLVMLSVVPPLAVAVIAIGRVLRRRSRGVQDRLAEASARVQEAVGAIETVQGFGREEDEAARYARGVDAAFEAARWLAVWRGLFMAASTFAGFAAIALVVWVGGRAVASGEMSGGDLAAFMLYSTVVAVSVGSLTVLFGSLMSAAGATERLFEIIDTQPIITSPTTPKPLPAGRGTVRFEGVEVVYPSRPDATVLERIDLTIAPGETVALVGRSGAGKTTLAKLLPRFFDPTRGVVRLEGVDLRELDLGELRRAVATVSQEPVLFSGTLRENIAYAVPGATDADVERVAKSAAIDELARILPDGWSTQVGERGVQLSGGQRQRVALARALLANPRVLVLDEATSHLDAESEAAIQRALDALLVDRTALIIAHRLSTVRRADRILVLDRGRVVEEGNHATLMARGGLYRRLVELQMFGDAESEPDGAENDGGWAGVPAAAEVR